MCPNHYFFRTRSQHGLYVNCKHTVFYMKPTKISYLVRMAGQAPAGPYKLRCSVRVLL